MLIAKVIPLTRLPAHLGEFDYSVNEQLTSSIVPGVIARIPFRQSLLWGLVTKITNETSQPQNKQSRLKTIFSLFSQQPLISSYQLNLIDWFSEYYCVSKTLPALMCVPKLPSKKTIEIPRTPKIHTHTPDSPTLTVCLDNSKKIEFYNQLIEKNVSKKTQTFLMCPLAKDAARLAGYYEKKYPSKTLCTTSISTPSGHLQTYINIMSGKPLIIIGTRSSLFFNFPTLSTVIIDRSHRREYKQFDLNPRYDARDVALKLCEFSQNKFLSVSHAPRMEDWENKKLERHILSDTPAKSLPIRIIQLHQEWRKGTNSFLSQQLLDEIPRTLQRNKHVFLLLNRKGFGKSVLCATCQYLFECEECNTPQFYSKRTSLLSCPQCTSTQELPAMCPNCHGSTYTFLGYGIERIAEELRKLFPQANVYECVKETNGKNVGLPLSSTPSIIIGTNYFIHTYSEYIPSLGLIAMLHGDPMISKTDFRSSEQQFQELMNFAMLTGQHAIPLLIQIFKDQAYPFENISLQSLSQFYDNLKIQRNTLSLPPYSQMIKIFPKSNSLSCENLLQSLKKQFGKSIEFNFRKPQHKKDKGYLLLRSKTFPKELFLFLRALPPGWMIDRDPITF